MAESEPLHGQEDLDESRRLYEQGWTEMQRGDRASAIRLFEESLRERPHYKTLLLLGECLITERRLKDAVVPLAAASTLNRQGVAPTLLAEVFLELGQTLLAEDMLTLALERQPDFRRAKTLKPKVDHAVSRLQKSWGLPD